MYCRVSLLHIVAINNDWMETCGNLNLRILPIACVLCCLKLSNNLEVLRL